MSAIQEAPQRPHVCVIGAGPAGCLAALLLARSGATVSLVDLRPDLRDASAAANVRQRSINLAVSARGRAALRHVGLEDALCAVSVPMYGRCVHLATAANSKPSDPPVAPAFQAYGQPHEHLLSVSRTALTSLLIDACDAHPDVSLSFGTKCIALDLHARTVTLQPPPPQPQRTEAATLIVGADGAFSKVRAALAREPHFDFSQSYIPTLYKELTMEVPAPAAARKTGKGETECNGDGDDCRIVFPPNGLHIWPRGEYMLIALPNDENGDTFTSTLFMPKAKFEDLQSGADVRAFFEDNFPDAIPALPSLEKDYFDNPTAPLVTMRCQPFNFGSAAVLVGDAAHAIVPFYGQGANASLEDCVLLADAINAHGWNALTDALNEYATKRKPNVDAIANLALEHYYDMSSKTASPIAVLKRRLEILANKMMPSRFLPLYSMISFSTIPYAEAVVRAEAQERTIMRTAGFVAAAAATATTAIIFSRKVQLGKFDLPALLRA